jgi:uncharacterized membrane protein YjgN (DUF898 family)
MTDITGSFFDQTAEMSAASGPFLGSLPLLVIAGLILFIYPYFVYLQQRYVHGNIAYGKLRSLFHGTAGHYYAIYLYAVCAIGISLICLALLSAYKPALAVLAGSFSGRSSGAFGLQSLTSLLLIYTTVGILYVIVSTYLFVEKTNYAWCHTQLGPVLINLSMEPCDLILIRLTNFFAIAFSAGLLIPWARVRRTRYIMSRSTVILPPGMDTLKTAGKLSPQAPGQPPADFVEWDIGW